MKGLKRSRDGQIVRSGTSPSGISDEEDESNQPAPNSSDHSVPTSANTTNTKRYQCTFQGCDKSYSRAEHLCRHQLNHFPKDIYKCGYPGCNKTFVRQDLCVRHRARHEAPDDVSTGVVVSKVEPGTSGGDDEKPSKSSRRAGRPRLNQKSSRNEHQQSSESEPRPSQYENQVDNGFRTQDADGLVPTHSRNHSSSMVNLDFSGPHDPGVYMTNDMAAATSIVNTANIRYQPELFMSQPETSPANRTLGQPPVPETLNESPASVRDDFTAWLFDDQSFMQNGMFPGPMNTSMLPEHAAPYGGVPTFLNYFSDSMLNDVAPNTNFPYQETADAYVEAEPSIVMSHAKRMRLLEFMDTCFNEFSNHDVHMLKQELFQGNHDEDDHVLSMRSMQRYLRSFWTNFNPQMPLLHQPTFSADNSQDLLVLAVMVIGASFLTHSSGPRFTDIAAKFAHFVSWHLRWQIFVHDDFRPPAKLWVFQTLLLLEFYEKMISTRAMHERAHIHCATTITLMRRGTALIDDALDAPQGSRGQHTPDDSWNRWVRTEALRRAAFAAFILDSLHAIMFGHAAIMVVHELRLPLPCDDALWSATSAAEVGRVQSSLHAHGIRPVSFLEGLKRTLTGRSVKANTFGRTILMAGLLSITWHLYQRDLQISSLGASQTLGVPGQWRQALTKAFDFWKKDLDQNVSHVRDASLGWLDSSMGLNEDVLASADVLHRLSHIALHADVMDCQIYAGAKKLFGRATTRADFDRIKHKMSDWASSAAGREATYHSLQLIRGALGTGLQLGAPDFYSAKNDRLLNRPWVLYYAILIIWSYGFALDGPLRPFPYHLAPSQDTAGPPGLLMGASSGVRSSTPHSLHLRRTSSHHNNGNTNDGMKMSGFPHGATSGPNANMSTSLSPHAQNQDDLHSLRNHQQHQQHQQQPQQQHGNWMGSPTGSTPTNHMTPGANSLASAAAGPANSQFELLKQDAQNYLNSVGAVKSPDQLLSFAFHHQSHQQHPRHQSQTHGQPRPLPGRSNTTNTNNLGSGGMGGPSGSGSGSGPGSGLGPPTMPSPSSSSTTAAPRRNNLVGLLTLFEHSFRDSRWELLQEGANRLKGAVALLRTGEPG